MQGHLILTNCLTGEVTRPAIERALKGDDLLWLDLEDTGPETIALLRKLVASAYVVTFGQDVALSEQVLMPAVSPAQ